MACFLAIFDPYPYGIPQKAAVMRGDVANLLVLLRSGTTSHTFRIL